MLTPSCGGPLVRSRYLRLPRSDEGLVQRFLIRGDWVQYDGIQSNSDGPPDYPIPGDQAHRGSAAGSEASVPPSLHEGGHPSAGRGRRVPVRSLRSLRRCHAAHDAASVRGTRRCAVQASGGTLPQPSVPSSPVRDVPPPSSDGGEDAADPGAHRRAPQASSRRSAGLSARGHGASGRPGWQEGPVRDQSRGRGHAVRVRGRHGGHVGAVPDPGSAGRDRGFPLQRQGFPRRQRLRVRQPQGRRAAEQAARRRVHEVPPETLRRQRPGREQECLGVRRYLGHDHIPRHHAALVDRFLRDVRRAVSAARRHLQAARPSGPGPSTTSPPPKPSTRLSPRSSPEGSDVATPSDEGTAAGAPRSTRYRWSPVLISASLRLYSAESAVSTAPAMAAVARSTHRVQPGKDSKPSEEPDHSPTGACARPCRFEMLTTPLASS